MLNKKQLLGKAEKEEFSVKLADSNNILEKMKKKEEELDKLGVSKVITMPIQRYEELIHKSMVYDMTYNILDDIMENHRMVDVNYIINLLGSLFFESGVTLDKEE